MFPYVFPWSTGKAPLGSAHILYASNFQSRMQNPLNLSQRFPIFYQIRSPCLEAVFQKRSDKCFGQRQVSFRPPRSRRHLELVQCRPCLFDRFLTLQTKFEFPSHYYLEVSCLLGLFHRYLMPSWTHDPGNICFSFYDTPAFAQVQRKILSYRLLVNFIQALLDSLIVFCP